MSGTEINNQNYVQIRIPKVPFRIFHKLKNNVQNFNISSSLLE